MERECSGDEIMPTRGKEATRTPPSHIPHVPQSLLRLPLCTFQQMFNISSVVRSVSVKSCAPVHHQASDKQTLYEQIVFICAAMG
ncbi:uncharacterized [Tachysurus ichikawai]